MVSERCGRFQDPKRYLTTRFTDLLPVPAAESATVSRIVQSPPPLRGLGLEALVQEELYTIKTLTRSAPRLMRLRSIVLATHSFQFAKLVYYRHYAAVGACARAVVSDHVNRGW